ncbi:MAG: RNA polymerase sigma factor [Verrucomicrobia bacterium]|nr:RNA polymerase sigma factor [Verrucomicrobiota bacterium]
MIVTGINFNELMSEPPEFEVFMKAYQNMVFTTAVRLLGRPEEAEDVSQEVFLKAYERFGQLQQSPTAGGWLKTVTTNMCLNHLTRYRARLSFFSDLFSGKDDQLSEIDFPAPDTMGRELEEADFKSLLERALRKLPVRLRVPLVLYHFENLSYEEIAAKLLVSLSKVKTDIFRARESLRKVLRLLPGVIDELDAFDPNRSEEPESGKEPKSASLWQNRHLLMT